MDLQNNKWRHPHRNAKLSSMCKVKKRTKMLRPSHSVENNTHEVGMICAS